MTKFFFGNNIENLSFVQLSQAVQKLKNEIRLPIEKFYVTRIDFGVTFEMESIVSNYLDVLIDLPRYQVRTYGNETKCFVNKIKTLNFYNKTKESIKSKQQTSDNIPKNLLRYELQIKNVNRAISKVTLSRLLKKDYIGKFLKMWTSGFYKIKKNNDLIDLESINIKTNKDFINLLASRAIYKMGKQSAFNLLDKLSETNKIDRRRISEIKKHIENNENKLCSTKRYTEELKFKINEFAGAYL